MSTLPLALYSWHILILFLFFSCMLICFYPFYYSLLYSYLNSQECTVLTIAHRLQTIIDSDRIMVLRNGVVAEIDTFKALLAKPDGLFTSMWAQHNANAK